MSDTSPISEGAFSNQGKKASAERTAPDDEPVPVIVSVEHTKPPSLFIRYGLTALIAAIVSAFVAGIVAAVVSIGVQLGTGGGRPGDRLTQEGKLMAGPNGDREVFYAEPFAGPPKLELESGNMNFITLKEQKADHFTIQAAVNSEVRWRAEGLRKK